MKLRSISFIIALSTAGVTGWPADACFQCDKAVMFEVMTKKRCSSTIWCLIFTYFFILKLFVCVL